MNKLKEILWENKYLNVSSVVVAVCLSAWGAWLRVYHRSWQGLFIDELYHVNGMGDGFLNFLQSLKNTEYFPYLSGDHLLIYPFFQIFGRDKWGLAIPHMVSTVIGFWMLFLVCRRHFKTIWGYLITFSLFVFNANLIHHALEIRWYSVLATLSLVSFYLNDILINEFDSLSARKKWGIWFLFFLTAVFHAYGILIVAFPAAYFLGTHSPRRDFGRFVAKFVPFYLGIVVCVAPLFILSSLKHAPYIDLYPFEYIPNPLDNFGGFLKGIVCNLAGKKALYFLGFGVALALIIPYNRQRSNQIGFILTLIILPIMLLLYSDLQKDYYFIQRQFVFVMPWFAFLVGWSWETILAFLQKRA